MASATQPDRHRAMHATIASPPSSDDDESDLLDEGYFAEEEDKSLAAVVASRAGELYDLLNVHITPPSERRRRHAPLEEDAHLLALAWFTTLLMLVGAKLSLAAAKAALLITALSQWTPEVLAQDELAGRERREAEAPGKAKRRRCAKAAARVAARRAALEGALAGELVGKEDGGDGGDGEGGRAAGCDEGVSINKKHNPVSARGDLPSTEPTSVGAEGGAAAEGCALYSAAQGCRPPAATAPLPPVSETANMPASATASGGAAAAAGRSDCA